MVTVSVFSWVWKLKIFKLNQVYCVHEISYNRKVKKIQIRFYFKNMFWRLLSQENHCGIVTVFSSFGGLELTGRTMNRYLVRICGERSDLCSELRGDRSGGEIQERGVCVSIELPHFAVCSRNSHNPVMQRYSNKNLKNIKSLFFPQIVHIS